MWYIRKHCDRGTGALGLLPSDKQARLISSLSVMVGTDSKIKTGRWLDNFNNGELYGDRGFIDLASFRQM